MKPVPVPPASGPMNGAHSPAAFTCPWSSAISASACVVLAREHRLVRDDVRLHEGAHLLSALHTRIMTAVRRRVYLMRHGDVAYFDADGRPVPPDDVPLTEARPRAGARSRRGARRASRSTAS